MVALTNMVEGPCRLRIAGENGIGTYAVNCASEHEGGRALMPNEGL